MAGLHVVRKQLKLVDRYYVYAWRGGPCIFSQDERPPVITHDILAKQQEARASQFGKSKDGFDQVILAYEKSPQFTNLAKTTRDEYRRWIRRASERWGNVPTLAFEDRRMRGDIIEWRNTWASQPRTADSASMIMNILLGWAVEHGILRVNVAAKINKLHKVSRADLIWEESHWEQVYAAKIPEHIMDVLRVGSWTGLRLSDLLRLDWGHVGTNAVIMVTNKRKGRAVIPILPEFRAWLDSVPEDKRSGSVLKNSRGKAWTKSGFESVWQRAKPEAFDRHVHDLRGTFCTMLILKGLNDEQVAMIMGWTAKRVAEIRARYVDEERVIVSLAERLSA